MTHLTRAAFAATLLLGAACSTSQPDTAKSSDSAIQTLASASGDVAPAAARSAHPPAAPADSATVTVYKSPTCGCCRAWVDHMEDAGFKVVAIDRNDLQPIKHAHGITDDLGSCHTALVGGYVVEGHVPAADVKRLLAERPSIAGLAVPGMPIGSPGMEGPIRQRYNVIAFDRAGGRSVFASH